jgi:hypothetical protein
MFHHGIRVKCQFVRRAGFGVLFAGLLLICFQSCSALAADVPESLDRGFHQMYNLDFAAAHKTFENWEATHPEDPLGAASNAAAYLFGEFERLHILEFDVFTEDRKLDNLDKFSDPQIKAAFEAELTKADELAAKALEKAAENTNALFARMLADGLRGDYAAMLEKRKIAALDFLKSSRCTAEKLIALDPSYTDAYLAIGLENYVLGLRSAPSRFVLRLTGAETNKEKGIANLKVTAEKGHYLAPYARLLLAIACLRDKDRETAKQLLTELVKEFPRNSRYKTELNHLLS